MFFLQLVFLFSCAGELDTLNPEKVEEILSDRSYTEYEGVALSYWDECTIGLLLDGSDQPDLDEHFGMNWEIGKEISFYSRTYEFDITESEIAGLGSCCEHLEHAAGVRENNGWDNLIFEPSLEFWECLDSSGHFEEREAFRFLLFVRMKI